MSRMFDDGAAPVAQKTRTRVIHCPHCSIELNLPESALGRRLKCPKCEVKFQAPSSEASDSMSSASSMFLPTRGGSSGSHELPSFGSGSGSGSSVELPPSLAPLRETFDLPLLSEDLPRRPAAPNAAAKPEGDVRALFQDEPKSNRRLKGAEARLQARRCTSCSTVVPAGMSLCSRCGLDLDTGQRHTPLDIFEEEMPATRQAPLPPLGVLMVGSLCSIGFLLLATIALVKWLQGGQGYQCLLVVWLFGLYAGAQFLRRKAIRPILVALSLAVGIATVSLIALPIYNANYPQVTVGDDSGFSAPQGEVSESTLIKPLEERLDLKQIYFGVGSLLSYAGLAVYLNSPGLRRQFHRR